MTPYIAVIFGIVASVFSDLAASQYIYPANADEGVAAKKRSIEGKQREATARKWIGKTIWYEPNASSGSRLTFPNVLPMDGSSASGIQNSFVVTTSTSFKITNAHKVGRVMEDYWFDVTFPDGKTGYLSVKDFEEHLYGGRAGFGGDKLFTRPPKEVIAAEREAAARARGAAAKASADAQAAEEARLLKGGVRLGMTKEQALASSWGRPRSVNRTTTAAGVREQWVYDHRYLHFENGVLTAIQD
jgi:hypothetical protein